MGAGLAVALVVAVAAPARAQTPITFSLSDTGSAVFGDLEDQEIGFFDPASAELRAWLRTASGAFFTGDVDGDGFSDAWNDVDAWWVESAAVDRVGTVAFSLLSNLGGFLDGDVLELTADGQLRIAHAESEVIGAFGVTDGNLDVDAWHRFADGTAWLSFAENEDSNRLSGDQPGVIGDGDLLSWNPATGVVSVLMPESALDAMVSQAIGLSVRIGDLLGVSADASGTIHFCVQSPSDHDATVFSSAAGGSVVVAEADLGFFGSVEMNALSLTPAGSAVPTPEPDHLTVLPGTRLRIGVSGGAAGDGFLVMLGLSRGDATRFRGEGIGGLFLDPSDPLFRASISGVWWLQGTFDGSGRGEIELPPAPAGVQLQLLGQPFDLTQSRFGVPFVVDFEG